MSTEAGTTCPMNFWLKPTLKMVKYQVTLLLPTTQGDLAKFKQLKDSLYDIRQKIFNYAYAKGKTQYFFGEKGVHITQ